jgi:predicted enzyme related to lactoylglutathione lyase
MRLHLSRVIIFTSRMKEMSAFYGKQLGLTRRIDPKIDPSEWIEFGSGATRIALHKAGGQGKGSSCAHKLVFYAKDVAKARAALVRKKIKMGPIKKFGSLVMCDGNDPAGNRIQISNRK